METDGGGWTVLQRRQDGSVNFYRNWTDYEDGFGNLTGEFWLGLSKIHRLTQEGSNTLRVDLGDFNSNTSYAQYTIFSVGNSTTEYNLTVGGYSGTAGDSMNNDPDNATYRYHNGMKFSTRDNDNDRHPETNCAQQFTSAWWFNACYLSHLNGPYYDHPNTDAVNEGVLWYSWKGWNYSLKFTEMKARRNNG